MNLHAFDERIVALSRDFKSLIMVGQVILVHHMLKYFQNCRVRSCIFSIKWLPLILRLLWMESGKCAQKLAGQFSFLVLMVAVLSSAYNV